MNNYKIKSGKRSGLSYSLIWFVIGIVLNMAGSAVADRISLPVYLDCIGTIVASAGGGLLPGILVGFVTNLLKTVADPTSIYYMSANMLAAVITVWIFQRKKWFSVLRLIGLAAVLAVACGSFTAVLVWFMENQQIAADSAMVGGMHPLVGSIINNWSLDFLDKGISVLIATLVLFILLRIGLFRNEEKEKSNITIPIRKISLRSKLILFLSIVIVGIGLSAIGIGAYLFRQSAIQDHITLGEGAVSLVASKMDPERVGDWLAYGPDASDYTEVEEELTQIRYSYPDIEYVYVYQIREDGCHVVFDLDTDEVEGSEPGSVIPFDESFAPYIEDLLQGNPIEPIITNDTFGWLMTAYQPVYDQDGDCVCYAAVDISMYQLGRITYSFIAKLSSLFLTALLMALALLFWFSKRKITEPVNRMAEASVMALDTEEDRRESIARMEKLSISTGDEIEHLYGVLLSNMKDTVSYMERVRKQGEDLAKMQDGLIMVLAEVVESRDKCTGNHIRNTATYVRLIMQEMKKEGIYADQMTEEFMQSVARSAPLHDVGKIKIPDAVLNKPGRLTDDEFTLMKTHTTGGTEIIDEAIEIVPDSMYLEETRNLALYHHEKWDGSGYPTGLKGEEIPLSARIMAVADVFDALVSTRSYKKGFPVEKALDIIREGSGSHFDPNVVKAFLACSDEAARLAEKEEKRKQEQEAAADADQGRSEKKLADANQERKEKKPADTE